MRIMTFWLAFLCRRLALLFGRFGIMLESSYYRITEERRA